ncbi:23S rRNA (uracil(1939)-C(5))-methyltransferase RlmD [Alteromonas aestuariivivens]|uniref:23S rRNA (Uracil(1939)-C(5))-methyltransferase RlmD n=1 Tax=Alteromonas aestuariivivens TaxID=1938339 RepID=A0A3D8MDZ5_9ALTE|nr:23S rRNA (uracil(1939)-C(5))-methyltransferase RlmD [Alteromonas aestuariivivens]RDV28087.1 23S rRNA (uracil(1939)-C(5))-methyltransferase RlmD [Alteromonas aestuariivivens]
MSIEVERWDPWGQGVCASHQPVMFVEGALPSEQCEVVVESTRKQHSQARVSRVVRASKLRVEPFCPVAGKCGGCQLQHIKASDALLLRQRALTDYWCKAFKRQDIPWQAPLTGPTPAYRRVSRLAVDARNPRQFKLGFRKAQSKDVVSIHTCPILEPRLSRLIEPLQRCLAQLESRRHIGHIGLMAGDDTEQVCVKVTRPVGVQFTQALTSFALEQKVNMLVELPDGSYQRLHQNKAVTCSTVDGLSIQPEPNDFIQVNATVNSKMVEQAMQWLEPGPKDVIADWFSGLGNFSLSLAKHGAKVQAVEGVAEMVQRAKSNALRQGITTVDWLHLDLGDEQAIHQALQLPFNKVLLDPSREGAYAVCRALAEQNFEKIVYVSCNPSTFTRDAQVLLESGYRLEKVGIIEMFPYTKHLEVMALFTGKAK